VPEPELDLSTELDLATVDDVGRALSVREAVEPGVVVWLREEERTVRVRLFGDPAPWLLRYLAAVVQGVAQAKQDDLNAGN